MRQASSGDAVRWAKIKADVVRDVLEKNSDVSGTHERPQPLTTSQRPRPHEFVETKEHQAAIIEAEIALMEAD